MSPIRGALLVLGAVLFAVWLAAAAGAGRPPAEIQVPSAAPAVGDPAPDLPPPPVERLAERLRERPSAPRPSRNPFSFDVPPPTPSPPPSSGLAPMAGPTTARPESAALTLIGVAEDATAEGPARTAMVLVAGELYFAEVGTSIAGRYTVTAIAAEAIEVTDAVTGARLSVSLN